MVAGDLLDRFQISQCAGDSEDAVVGTGAEIKVADRGFQNLPAGVVRFTEFLYLAGLHIGVPTGSRCGEAVLLDTASCKDAFADNGRRFAARLRHQVIVRQWRHLDVDIDAIEERSRDA